MADYATGGVIPPGSSITFGDSGCELFVPPSATEGLHYLRLAHEVARATGVTLTVNSAADSALAQLLLKAMRRRPDDGAAGVLAKV